MQVMIEIGIIIVVFGSSAVTAGRQRKGEKLNVACTLITNTTIIYLKI